MNRLFRRYTQRASCFLSLITVFTFLTAGCSDDDSDVFFMTPSSEPMKVAIRTSVALTYAASVAMESVDGGGPSNAFVTNTCSSFPCLSLVTIALDEQTFPLELESYGTLKVAGLWTSEDHAILTVYFVDMNGGSRVLPVDDVSTFPATRTSTGWTIVYPNVTVNLDTGPVEPSDLTDDEIQFEYDRFNIAISDDPQTNIDVGLDIWSVDADHNGTPQDFSDDSYIISGANQHIAIQPGSTSVVMLAMVHTVLTADCALNPSQGLVLYQEVDIGSYNMPVVGQAFIEFEPDCDGTMRVILGTGNYLFSTGDSVPLRLNEP